MLLIFVLASRICILVSCFVCINCSTDVYMKYSLNIIIIDGDIFNTFLCYFWIYTLCPHKVVCVKLDQDIPYRLPWILIIIKKSRIWKHSSVRKLKLLSDSTSFVYRNHGIVSLSLLKFCGIFFLVLGTF